MELGSTVKLLYTGTLDDGTVFGIGTPETPMEFQTGMDMVIPGFERNILEMNEPGERRSFHLGIYDAYGEYLEGNIVVMPREIVPTDNIRVGKRVWVADEDGQMFPFTVMKIENGNVTFDANHPLAGKELNFDVEILEVTPPPEGFIPEAEKRRQLEGMQPHDSFEGGASMTFL